MGPESGLGGGRRTYVRTDVWKFTPVSYRTSALWGRCPKREREKEKEKEKEKEERQERPK